MKNYFWNKNKKMKKVVDFCLVTVYIIQVGARQ